MRKKFNLKIFLLFSISFFVLTTSASCAPGDKSYLIPDENEYGKWDGNYIYYGTNKCKTTGEDEECFIKEIIYEDEKYVIKDFNNNYDDYIIEDSIEYIVCTANKVDENEQETPDDSKFILKYDFATDQVDILLADINDEMELSNIYKTNDEYLLVGSRYTNSVYSCLYKLHLDNLLCETIAYNQTFTLKEEYAFVRFDKMTYLTNINNIDLKPLPWENIDSYIILEIDDIMYLKVILKDDSYEYNEFYLYDLKNEIVHTIVDKNEGKHFEIIDDEYFILGDLYETHRKNGFEHKYIINNVLYKIDLQNANKREKIFEFPIKKAQFLGGRVRNDEDEIVFNAALISKNITGKYDEINYDHYYVLELDTLSFYNTSEDYYSSKTSTNLDEPETAYIVYGNRIYFMEVKLIIDRPGNKVYTYKLYVKNKTTNALTLMQWFTNGRSYFEDLLNGTKQCRYAEVFSQTFMKHKFDLSNAFIRDK